ncbi:hypothetical protein HY636_05080 [Candidatus Woesearchaeota archaeon]|nr:hypothetical protein [Candidatus Woesearchaeota archaeon]
MKNKKRGQAGIVPAFIVILSSLLVVSAIVTNSTNESFNSFNDTLNITPIVLNETSLTNLIISLNETNETIQNQTITINETINLTIPIENGTLPNQSTIANETINPTATIGDVLSTNETSNLTLSETFNNQSNISLINQSINPSEGLISANLPNLTIIIENQSANNVFIFTKLFNEDNVNDYIDVDSQKQNESTEDNKLIEKHSLNLRLFKNFLINKGLTKSKVKISILKNEKWVILLPLNETDTQVIFSNDMRLKLSEIKIEFGR